MRVDQESWEEEEACRERHRSPHVPWGQTLLERNKPEQTGLKECVGPAMTEGPGGGNTGV